MKTGRSEIKIFFRKTLPSYVSQVLYHWWVVGFCVILAIVGMVADMKDYDVPNWFWLVVILLGIHSAQFLAWNDVRKERDKLKRYEVTQESLSKVAEYRSEQIKFQNEKIKSEEQLGSWWQRYLTLREEIIEHIKNSFSSAEARLFERLGTFDLVYMPGDPEQISYKYLQRRSWIIRDHKWLDQLAKDYGRQRYRAEIEAESDRRD